MAYNTCDPTVERSLTLEDGRKLSYLECGRPGGHPFIYFHGLPGSRYESRLWEDVASQDGYRVIALDRPGMAASTTKANRTLLDYVHDVAALIDELQLVEYSIIGVSGGSAYALACAARKNLLPGLHQVTIVAGWGPRKLMREGTSIWQRLAMILMDIVPRSIVRGLWNMLIGDAARNPDKTVLERRLRPGLEADNSLGHEHDRARVANIMIDNMRAAFQQGAQGYVDDASLISSSDWGFALNEIKDVLVYLWYGGKDTLTPAATGRAMKSLIGNATFNCFPADNHTDVVMRHQSTILGDPFLGTPTPTHALPM